MYTAQPSEPRFASETDWREGRVGETSTESNPKDRAAADASARSPSAAFAAEEGRNYYALKFGDFHYVLKFVLVGNVGVGKSSVLLQLTERVFMVSKYS